MFLVIVAMLLWHLIGVALPAIGKGIRALVPFLYAFATAYLLRHPVIGLDKCFYSASRNKKHRWQHLLSTSIVILLFFGVFVGLALIIVPNVFNNLVDMIGQLPAGISRAEAMLTAWIGDLSQWLKIDVNSYAISFIDSVSDKAVAWAQSVSTSGKLFSLVGTFFSSTASFALDVMVYVVATFYLLYDFERIKHAIKRGVRLFFHEDDSYDRACRLLHVSDVTIEKYIVVKLCTALAFGIVSYIGFLIMGLPYPVLLAAVIAITDLIPYIGPIVGAAFTMLIALVSNGLSACLWSCVFLIICQQVEGNIITPLVVGDVIKASPLIVLLGIAVFGAMFGIPGMVLGAPLGAITVGVIKEYITQIENKDKKENLS